MKEKNKFKNLIIFFLITLIFTWMFWIPDALSKRGVIQSNFFTNLGFLGSLGPLFSVILIIIIQNGFNGVKSFITTSLSNKFPIKYWFYIFLLFPVLISVSYYISLQFEQGAPVSEAKGMYHLLPLIFFSVMFTGGPIQEEFGWRGYALPIMQKRFNSFISSFLLGIIWGIWHWPQFLVPKDMTGMFYINPFWSFMLTIIFANFIYTWLYNETKHSILAMLILHTQMNLFFWVFPVLYTNYGYLIILLTFAIASIIVVIFNKKMFFKNSN